MTTSNKKKKAYLDPSFLACFFIPNHEFHQHALIMFAKLRSQGYKLYISPLTLDELWMVIYKNKISLKLAKRGISDAAEDIKKSWEMIQEYKRIKLIQIKRPIGNGVNMALILLEYNNIQPRDAFHLATASSHNIFQIVVKDKKLIKASKTGIAKQFAFLEF